MPKNCQKQLSDKFHHALWEVKIQRESNFQLKALINKDS